MRQHKRGERHLRRVERRAGGRGRGRSERVERYLVAPADLLERGQQFPPARSRFADSGSAHSAEPCEELRAPSTPQNAQQVLPFRMAATGLLAGSGT